MHERTIYAGAPIEALDMCCDRHKDVPPADHTVGAVSFVIDEHEYGEGIVVPSQRFALMVMADKNSVEHGVKLTPRIVMMMLDTFAELVNELGGPRLMAAAMVEKLIHKFGAEMLADNDGNTDLDGSDEVIEVPPPSGTPANPIVGGRRRGDYRH